MYLLKFDNRDVIPQVCHLEVGSERQAYRVMEWYGAFYAGDDYDVSLDGRTIPMDQNGCRELPTIDVEPTPNLKLIT